MESRRHYLTWVEIDRGAIENNVRYFVKKTTAKVMAVVKANGYGHDAVQTAKAALNAGATWCAVARVDEALELRQHGLTCPILLLGLAPSARISEMLTAQISMAVWQQEHITAIADVASREGEQARLHLKVDTGMGRLGVQPEQVPTYARYIVDNPDVIFEGLFTHYARADERDPAPSDEQDIRFLQALSGLDEIGLRPALVHAANSAAALRRAQSEFDLVRVGISIYGLHPSKDAPLPVDFRAALSWKTQLSQIKVLSPGHGVSYGHMYVTSGHERIGTLPIGYADGFRRIEGNQVLVAGQRAPVVGRVCMDQCMVQLDAIPDVKAGDEVVLIGQQGEERISAEEVAERWGTINYEVTCGIGARVPRVFS
ncbi:MAG: alanine racemase [Anaerolineales bacterium]|nr:alanine racemase [Anaerolineales bacterium]